MVGTVLWTFWSVKQFQILEGEKKKKEIQEMAELHFVY